MTEVTREEREAAESLAIRICSCATTSQHKADVAAVLAFREECLDRTRVEMEAMRAAALDLYEAGRWELSDRFISADEQAVMWERLRDALGLQAGHSTALTRKDTPDA